MAEEIFMDIPKLQGISKQFGKMGNDLNQISQTLKTAVALIKASAFVGLIGNAVYAEYVDNLQKQIEKFANQCEEMGADLKKSADAYQKGDAAGATRFN